MRMNVIFNKDALKILVEKMDAAINEDVLKIGVEKMEFEKMTYLILYFDFFCFFTLNQGNIILFVIREF